MTAQITKSRLSPQRPRWWQWYIHSGAKLGNPTRLSVCRTNILLKQFYSSSLVKRAAPHLPARSKAVRSISSTSATQIVPLSSESRLLPDESLKWHHPRELQALRMTGSPARLSTAVQHMPVSVLGEACIKTTAGRECSSCAGVSTTRQITVSGVAPSGNLSGGPRNTGQETSWVDQAFYLSVTQISVVWSSLSLEI